MLFTLISSSIETGLNFALERSPKAQPLLKRLKGKTVRVEIKNTPKKLTFVFSNKVDVLLDFEGVADCDLSVSASAISELNEQANITSLIKAGKLDLDGDIRLAQVFSEWLDAIKPDWAEWLSHYIGDVASYEITSRFHKLTDKLRASKVRLDRQFAEALTDEWRMAPSELEVAYFCEQVDELKSQAERIQSRLNRMLENG